MTGKRSIRKTRKFYESFVLALLFAVIFFLFFSGSVTDLVAIRGQSMEPTLRNGSLVLVNKLAYGLRLPWAKGYAFVWNMPKINDIILFRSQNDGRTIIKRCSLTEGNLVLVKGDNSDLSRDAFFYGPVPLNEILGKVLKVHE